MFKVVINSCYGGFGLSDEAFERFLALKGVTFFKWEGKYGSPIYTTIPKEEYRALEAARESEAFWQTTKEYRDELIDNLNKSFINHYDIERDDPALIQVVEEMGDAANGGCAALTVVELPDDVQGKWGIGEYDGNEHVYEHHRTWG